jgi:hypothetical protein
MTPTSTPAPAAMDAIVAVAATLISHPQGREDETWNAGVRQILDRLAAEMDQPAVRSLTPAEMAARRARNAEVLARPESQARITADRARG